MKGFSWLSFVYTNTTLIPYHYNIICLTTAPWWVMHRVRASSSSFSFKYRLFYLRSPSICLRLLARLPLTSIFSSVTCFRRWFVRKIWPVHLALERLPTGWTVRETNPGGGEIFRTCPDPSWGQSSLLYNGYRFFPGGTVRPGRDADLSPPSSAEVKKIE